jgi:ABC-type proline/glycine betaine transport system permease subunit
MKTLSLPKPLLAMVAVTLAILTGNAVAQDSTMSNVTQPAVASQSAPPQLSYGVPQILQLAQAKVADDTIVAYIQNSGTIYALDASQIVYLKQQGVSDRVVTTMLNQRKNAMASTAQTAPPQNYSSDASSAQTSTAVAQPTVTYVQTVPTSSVYVIPNTQAYNYNAYYYQPYYYPYYAWSYPAVSLSFGFGGRWGGGGYYHGRGWHR